MEKLDPTGVQPDATATPDSPITNVSIIGSTPLCYLCNMLLTDQKTYQSLTSKPGLHFTRGRRSTLQNAVDGCRLCQELLCIPYNYVSEYWERVEREQGQNAATDAKKKNSKGWPVELWKSELGLLEPRGLNAKSVASDRDMHFSFKGDPKVSPSLLLTKHRSLWFAKKMIFEIGTYKDDPVAAEVTKRVYNRAIESATYSDLRTLLQRTPTTASRGPKGWFTPAFLINVQSDGGLRLHRCEPNKYLSYAALSFAWGATQTMTTLSNLDAHLAYLDFDNLSKTVQDAILATRELNLRFLWVDALCMIQDSEEHKVQQTSLLWKIFRNAYVSIIANCARTCNDGFLAEPRIRKRFEMPYCDDLGNVGTVFLTAVKPVIRDNPEIEWLQTRAWAHQELCFSTRFISYDSSGIHWDCSNAGKILQGIAGWTENLRLFSGKELTNACDKLPSISSLAAYYSSSLQGSKYLAGVFSAESHHQLCWYGTTGKRLSRPQEWRAPSWSPMAVDGPIELWHCWKGNNKVTPFLVENDGECHADFEILNSDVQVLTDQAPFGRVTSGFLQVRGRIMRLRKETLVGLSGIGNLLGGLQVPMSAAKVPGRVGVMYFDTVNAFGTRIASADSIQSNHGPLNENTKLVALAICKKRVVKARTDSETNVTTYEVQHWDAGLILAQLGNGDYHRVGHFLCNKKDIFSGSFKPEVLRIV